MSPERLTKHSPDLSVPIIAKTPLGIRLAGPALLPLRLVKVPENICPLQRHGVGGGHVGPELPLELVDLADLLETGLDGETEHGLQCVDGVVAGVVEVAVRDVEVVEDGGEAAALRQVARDLVHVLAVDDAAEGEVVVAGLCADAFQVAQVRVEVVADEDEVAERGLVCWVGAVGVDAGDDDLVEAIGEVGFAGLFGDAGTCVSVWYWWERMCLAYPKLNMSGKPWTCLLFRWKRYSYV